jgi:hypothetical protein
MIAETLLKGGAAVALHDINEEAPACLWRKPQPDGAGGFAFRTRRRQGDGRDRRHLQSGRCRGDGKKVEATLGPISILVNCAGEHIAAKAASPIPMTR